MATVGPQLWATALDRCILSLVNHTCSRVLGLQRRPGLPELCHRRLLLRVVGGPEPEAGPTLIPGLIKES